MCVYHDAGSNDVMGDLDFLEKTLLALLELRLHGLVDMTVRLGLGATRALPVLGDGGTILLPVR